MKARTISLVLFQYVLNITIVYYINIKTYCNFILFKTCYISIDADELGVSEDGVEHHPGPRQLHERGEPRARPGGRIWSGDPAQAA